MLEQKHRLAQASRILLAAFVATILIIGCDVSDVTGPDGQEIDRVVISPRQAEIAVGGQVDLSFFLLSATGDTIAADDLNMETEWITTDPDVVTLDQTGTATGQSPGEEYCIIDVTVHHGASNFNGRDTAVVFVSLF